jgi:serine/threonine protein kinase
MHKGGAIESFPSPFGRYELMERLGAGGMAEVFLARRPGLGGFEKTVVIKRILPALSNDPKMEEAFVAEAALTAQVQHKNVVQVFELDRLDNGEFFMTMEYVQGTDLARMLRSAAKKRIRMPPWLSVKIVAEVLDALAYVHDLSDREGTPRNLVHRDVSPSNIFISELGDVKLGDFGVAKDHSRESLTTNGEVKGKISYMSPEQIRREPIDRRTDVFAAGVVLWECLTQRRLFGRRPEIETMNLICSGPRIPPSRLKRDVPPELDRCALRALQPDPDARYQSARGFHTQLLDVLEDLHAGIKPSDITETVELLLGRRADPQAPVVYYDPFDEHTPSTALASPRVEADSRPDTDSSQKEYSGPHRFFARVEGEPELGPLDWFDLVSMLKKGSPEIKELSADRHRWVSRAELVRLTGQESLLHDGLLRGEPMEASSVIAALARIGLERRSGTLTIGGKERRGALPARVVFEEGYPTAVYTSSAQLQVPEIIVQENVVKIAQVPSLVRTSLDSGEPLLRVAAKLAGTDPSVLNARVMRRRLAATIEARPILRFDPEARAEAEPFAGSISSLLPAVVHEALSVRGLQSLLGPRIDEVLTATEAFEPQLPQFQLSQAELNAAKRLASGRGSIRHFAEAFDAETVHLYIGLVLLESGLLRTV